MNFNRAIIYSTGAVFAAVCLSGCATGTKKMEPVSPPPPPPPDPQVLRDMSVAQQPELEPEWADYVKDHYPNWRRHYWVDRGQWGNRGYMTGHAPTTEQAPEATLTPLPPVTTTVTEPPALHDTTPPKIEQPESKPTKYVVKKGDSLWKIAGKVYRNPLKWPRIYRANKEKIKNPNRIYTNQVLVIPQD